MNERDSLSNLQDLRELLQTHISSIEADKDIKYFDPIKSGRRCDLIICDQYEFAHLVGEVSGPPSKKLPNKERFDLGRNNRNAKDEKSLCELALVAEFGPIIDESNLEILSEIYVFMIQVKNIEAAKKLVLSQAITTSTPTSSPSHSDSTGSEKTSIADLLDLFLTPARAKETLKEMNILLSLEIVVFTADSNILLTPDRLPIGTDDDDLIPDIQI
ncbi:hypothetical protein F8M41_026411 [Gigaspora margarita]|uniref:Uncharacterized protein n=1 Tax=Gigaspora margarita TaxID=4874 RepID=A0A8H3XJY2_GIGMA|nr:hypothetical protein F8M41_026411 [Gigaspora margarita]